MIAVVQRVSAASVAVGLEAVGKIDRGLVALIGVSRDDTETDVNWLARKLTELRIFPDATGEKHFDLDVRAVGGAILLVSNFTIMAATHQGRRPSFDLAAGTEKGGQLFNALVEAVQSAGVPVQTGRFGADMAVHAVNDGPVTVILDSRERRGDEKESKNDK